ncbi:hypothetical protein J1N35_031712 [Gossypium stocksii]|uniref:Nodulin-like domain-containing protein n=1 Tax=Gossypium stocksii TaxID=47602 RepID=A0A9D3V2F6_9ROSI|nr:hypothetical protein J1N35_031712 [Gossypium stocksii]
MVCTFCLLSNHGSVYLFGTYSNDIKTTLGYDQTTINLLGFSKDVGANVGILTGLIAEITPTWFVLLLGAAVNFGGYFMIWLAVTGKIAKPMVWQMCLYMAIGANSQNFANTGGVVTAVKNFPESRGSLIGLLKGYAGLSGAIITQVYLAVYGNDSKSLIFLIACLPTALSLIFIYTIRTMGPVKHPNEHRVFNQFLLLSIVLALLLMVKTLIERKITFSKGTNAVITAVLCLLLFASLYILIGEALVVWNIKKQPLTAITIEQSKSQVVESSEETSTKPTSSEEVTGAIHDTEALKDVAAQGLAGKQLTCIGSHCYRLSFMILTSVSCFGALCSLILVMRTRRFYQSDIYQKFRENADSL